MSAITAHIDGISSKVTGEWIIRLSIPTEHTEYVQGLMPFIHKQVAVAFADLERAEEIPDHKAQDGDEFPPAAAPGNGKGPYGQQARKLRQSSFMRTPSVWEQIGSDEEFLAWIRAQKSCVSGDIDNRGDGFEFNEAAHVRRIAAGAGVGIEPKYAAVPLTHEEHQVQTNHGEWELLHRHGIIDAQPGEQIKSLESSAKSWFDEQRIKYVEEWCWQTLKATLGYEHWSEVPPEVLKAWAGRNGVQEYLPGEYA